MGKYICMKPIFVKYATLEWWCKNKLYWKPVLKEGIEMSLTISKTDATGNIWILKAWPPSLYLLYIDTCNISPW